VDDIDRERTQAEVETGFTLRHQEEEPGDVAHVSTIGFKLTTPGNFTGYILDTKVRMLEHTHRPGDMLNDSHRLAIF
jgi:hypothetical protein